MVAMLRVNALPAPSQAHGEAVKGGMGSHKMVAERMNQGET